MSHALTVGTEKRKDRWALRRWIAGIASTSLVAGMLVVAGLGAPEAEAATFAPAVSVDSAGAEGMRFVLAGEDATFEISAANSNGGEQFNLGFTALLPNGIALISGGALGAPKVYASGEVLPNAARTSSADCVSRGYVAAPAPNGTKCAVPAGMQLWVWSDVNDLPQGGTVSATVTVRPDADVYPVGSAIRFDVAAYTSSDPSLLPTFDGSLSVAKSATHTSDPGQGQSIERVAALRVQKTEPSPESELLRGVHDHYTTYTVTVDYSGEGDTNDAVVTDYLPAGLEYLGIQGGDNSTAGTEEYPGSGRIPGTWSHSAGEQVETVQITAAEATSLGLPGAGVYTKVTWSLGNLSGGTEQNFAGNQSGVPGTVTFSYRAGIPLFANEMWPEGTAPTASSGQQAANLDNNTGASTRHGNESAHAFAHILTNTVIASGTYQGAVRDEADRLASDTDSESVEAVDLHVIKSVRGGAAFVTSNLATYDLRIATSEYVDASNITLTDTIPNGLCTAFPASAAAPGILLSIDGVPTTQTLWNDTVVPGEACSFPSTQPGAAVGSALTVTGIDYRTAEGETKGTFAVTFELADLDADRLISGGTVASYTVMQRPNYTGPGGGTSSGDSFVNHVVIAGTTTSTSAIAGDPDLNAAIGGPLLAKDDSRATIRTELTNITKTVLERGVALNAATSGDWKAEAQQPFSSGDRVWYRITVPFAQGVDTRNPRLTDYLPVGVEFVSAKYAHTGLGTEPDVTTPTDRGALSAAAQTFIPNPTLSADPDSASWALGAVNRDAQGSTARFMPKGSTVTIYLEGRVTGQSASKEEVDSPLNHAKYQQRNVDGVLSFRRASAGIDIDWGSTLQKGIEKITPVSGAAERHVGPDFNARSATEQVAQGDRVAYRIDVTAPQNTTNDYVIWDVLPQGVTAADLDASSFRADMQDGDASGPTLVRNTDYTVQAYDSPVSVPGGPSIAASYADRSVVVWTISRDIPGSTAPTETGPGVVRGLSLGYTLVVPAGVAGGGPAAQLTQSYTNTAGIVSYDIPNNGASGASTIVPQKNGVDDGQVLTTRTPSGPGEYGVPDIDTYDSAEIHLPNADVTKRLLSTEVGPNTAPNPPAGINQIDVNNPDAAIVQGEQATFEYEVSIPARTTVKNATLSDRGTFAYPSNQSVTYEYVAGSAKFFDASGANITTGCLAAAGPTAFRCAETAGATHGVMTFPETYTNATDAPQVFRVQITAWVKDRDATNRNGLQSRTPNLGHNIALTNRATFSFDDPAHPGARIPRTADASVQYLEPNLGIDKSANPNTNVHVGDPITFTILVRNPGTRPASFENTVVDTVPEGLIYAPGSAKVNGTPVADANLAFTGNVFTGAGGTITWTPAAFSALQQVDGNETITLTYQAEIDPSTGGGVTYTNTATVTGHTLPATVGGDDTTTRRGDRAATDAADVTAITAAIGKGVRRSGATTYGSATSAPVGDLVEYRVAVTLNPNINYYDARVRDTLPAGFTLQGLPQLTMTTGAGAPVDVTADWSRSVSGQTSTWTLANPASGDLLSNSESRVLTITYSARVSSAVSGNGPLTNRADFTWATTNGGALRVPALEATANVNILNPQLSLAKAVKRSPEADTAYANSKNGEVDGSFTYRLRVTNASGATRSDAFNTVVVDTVPAGIVVDTSSFRIGGSPVSTPNSVTVVGNTITWNLPGAIAPGATRDLTYTATFAAASTLTTGPQTNSARISGYASFPSGGRTYPATTPVTANVTPLFPRVTITKAAADPTKTAYVGEPFEWILTATNSATGAAQKVVLTDTLPENWTFTEMQAVTIAGVAQSTPQTPTGSPSGPLVWTFGQDVVSGSPAPVLQPGQSISLRYTATPSNPAALTTPGTGATKPHINTLSVQATDRRGATSNASGSYSGPDATDRAFLREADLHLEKSAVGGVVDQGSQAANLHGLATGSWVPGQSVVPGAYTQPAWQIVVTNQGPDAAFGKFTVIDTPTLPAGVSVGAWTARYYSGPADTVGVVLPLSGAGTAASPFIVGTDATSLKADGTDRIELRAPVIIEANAAGTPRLENTADVTGRTYENPANLPDNEDEAVKPLSPIADLTLEKVVSNASTPNAGGAITWGITVTNRGPALSLSSTADPITITDTVPAGVRNVTAVSNTDWVATLANGDPIPAAGVSAGTEILWTYQHATMAVNVPTVVSLSGTILSSHTGALTNRATVNPGTTPEPADGGDPNTDEVTVTPTDDTTLAIAKTRVVLDGGAWRDATATDEFLAGDPISYRIDVTNTGTADARNVRVVDERPTQLSNPSVVSLTGVWTRTPGGTNAAGTTNANWDTFTLAGAQPAGSTRSYVVTYDTDPGMTAAVVNWAEAGATNATNDPRDRDDNTSTRRADLSIVKSHTFPVAGDPAIAGGRIDYRLVVTNHGPSNSGAPITVSDTLPTGLSYRTGTVRVSVAGGPANPVASTLAGQTITWTDLTGGAELADGATIVITFTADVSPMLRAQTGLANTATVSAPDDTDPSNNSSTDRVDVVTDTTVSITKDVEAGPWVAGTDVSYTLTVVNSGPSAASSAVVTDTLPAGLTLRSASGAGWDCTASVVGSQVATCTPSAANGLLPVGTTEIDVVARIGSSVPAGTALTNTAVVGWTDTDGSHTDDDDAQVTVSNEADLGVKKAVLERPDSSQWIDAQSAADAGAVVAGEGTRYRLYVTNSGPSDAVGPIVVTDRLPAGAVFDGLVTEGGLSAGWVVQSYDAAANTITFAHAAGFPYSASAAPLEVVYSVNFAANLPTGGPALENTVAIDPNTLAANNDADAANDADPAYVLPGRAVDLSIVKAHDASVVRIGDELPFTLDVANRGPSEATGVVVTDTVPAGLTVVSQPGDVVGQDWTLDTVTVNGDGTTTVVASLGRALDAVAPGNAAPTLTIVTEVTAAAYASVTNTAEVTSAEITPTTPDRNPSDNTATDQVEVPPLVTLITTKRAVGTFQVGGTGTYVITVKNTGPTEDPGPITVTDRLPKGMSFASATPSTGVSANGSVVTWTIPKGLPVGAQATLRLMVNLAEGAYPSITNVVTVASVAEKTPDSVLQSDATVAVAPADPLAVTGGSAVGYLAMLAALLMLAGAVAAATRRRREPHAE